MKYLVWICNNVIDPILCLPILLATWMMEKAKEIHGQG